MRLQNISRHIEADTTTYVWRLGNNKANRCIMHVLGGVPPEGLPEQMIALPIEAIGASGRRLAERRLGRLWFWNKFCLTLFD
jgi:hypothetical protein